MFLLCKCGCGKEVTREENNYINGHHNRGKSLSENTIKKMSNSAIGRTISIEAKEKMSNAKKDYIPWNKGLKGCQLAWNKGKTKETDFRVLKNTIPLIGKKQLRKTVIKRMMSLTGQKRKPHTPETKLKMSISAINYLEKHTLNGKLFCPRIGDNETQILDQIEKNMNIKFLRNNRDIFNKCGKWPDAYFKEYNIVIDILEPHHFKLNGELSNIDKNRELDISSRLGCMIYYISEQKFLSDPTKEIHRFKDFLDTVKIC